MKRSQPLLSILAIGLIFVLISLACGSSPESTPSVQEPTAVETAAGKAVEPTAAPASKGENAPTQVATDDSNGQAPTQPGGADQLVADLGFRPDKNDFSFENYGSENGAKNLTPVEVQRMFGDQVCALKKDAQCVLTPTGQQWME